MSEQSVDERLIDARQSGELDLALEAVYVISTYSGEKIIGVVDDERGFLGEGRVIVKKARQIFSMNIPVPGRGVVRKTMIGTLDLAIGPVDEILVKCSNYYRVVDQNLATKRAIWEELQDADNHDTQQRAAAAGIATASDPMVSDHRPFSGGL